MISAKEEPDASLPPAMDGLLRVHKRIIDGLDGGESAQASGAGGHVSTRLLVSASQAGSLIGKHGAVIKSIQEAAKSVVRIVGMGSHISSSMHDSSGHFAYVCYNSHQPFLPPADDSMWDECFTACMNWKH